MKMNIGVVIAMQEEAAPLLQLFGLKQSVSPYDGAQFYHDGNLTVAVGGVGTLAAAMATQTLIDKYQCGYIYNTGTAAAPAARSGPEISYPLKGFVKAT